MMKTLTLAAALVASATIVGGAAAGVNPKIVLVARLNDQADYDYHRRLAGWLRSKPMRIAKQRVHKERWRWAPNDSCKLMMISKPYVIVFDFRQARGTRLMSGGRVGFRCRQGVRCTTVKKLRKNGYHTRRAFGFNRKIPDEFRRKVIRTMGQRSTAYCQPSRG